MKKITIINEAGKIEAVIEVKDPMKIIRYAGLREVMNERGGMMGKESNGIEITVIIIGPPNITKVCTETLEPIINQMINT